MLINLSGAREINKSTIRCHSKMKGLKMLSALQLLDCVLYLMNNHVTARMSTSRHLVKYCEGQKEARPTVGLFRGLKAITRTKLPYETQFWKLREHKGLLFFSC